MSNLLTEFDVTGLQSGRDVRVKLRDDRLVLVGENGSGKTTLISLMFLFLSGQWHKLSQIEFEQIRTRIGEKEFVISSHDAKLVAEYGHLPSQHQWLDMFSEEPDAIFSEESRAHHRLYYARRLRDMEAEVPDPAKALGRLIELRSAVLKEFDATPLFLPTYRRIEQDLKSLFPHVDPEEILRRQRRPRTSRGGAAGKHVELVEFGMDDVKAHFTRATDRLKEHLRQELNTLLLRYLSDIISGAHNNVDLSKIAAVHDSSLAAMVSQIDEQYLPKTQRQELYNFITRLRSGDVTRPDTKVVAHFVGKLLDLHTAQQAQESRINSFVNTCNSYLENKQCVFDKQHFRLFIQPTPSSQDDALDLKNLSSGEKQIVSLFSEIILRENRKYYVFIDEPELSLSVDWQRRFLQDIVSSGYCAGLIAVTHSPFIFENALDQYAHDLAEFTSPRPVS